MHHLLPLLENLSYTSTIEGWKIASNKKTNFYVFKDPKPSTVQAFDLLGFLFFVSFHADYI